VCFSFSSQKNFLVPGTDLCVFLSQVLAGA
jgi:hypothetical protein